MLATMPRTHPFRHGALVGSLALAVLGCSGAAPPSVVPTAPPTPTPAPTVDVGAQVTKLVCAAFASDPLVMHVVQTASLTVSDGKKSVKENVSMTLDLSDRDLSAEFTTKTAGKTTSDMGLVALGKTVYARDGKGRWQSGPRANAEQNIADVIRTLPTIRDPAHLRYVGIETIGAQRLHHLTVARPFTYVMNIGQTGTFDTFDIWVEDDGTPVLAKGNVSAIGAYGVEIKGTNELRFSKFGGPIRIAAPKD